MVHHVDLKAIFALLELSTKSIEIKCLLMASDVCDLWLI